MRHVPLKLLMTELPTVRIVCDNCKAVIELPVDRWKTAFDGGKCRFCEQQTHAEKSAPLKALREALNDLVALKEIEIAFVLPDEEKGNRVAEVGRKEK